LLLKARLYPPSLLLARSPGPRYSSHGLCINSGTIPRDGVRNAVIADSNRRRRRVPVPCQVRIIAYEFTQRSLTPRTFSCPVAVAVMLTARGSGHRTTVTTLPFLAQLRRPAMQVRDLQCPSRRYEGRRTAEETPLSSSV